MRMQGNPMVFDESAGHEIGYLVIGFNDYHILPAFIHLSNNYHMVGVKLHLLLL